MFNVEEGVRDVFMEKYVLYEEYPTNSLTCILNSLLGFYDLKTVKKDSASKQLYQRQCGHSGPYL